MKKPKTWTIECDAVSGNPCIIEYLPDGGAVSVAEILDDCFPDLAHQHANARLIAAAPDLYASLREFVAHLEKQATYGLNDDEKAMLRRADAALAKANGLVEQPRLGH